MVTIKVRVRRKSATSLIRFFERECVPQKGQTLFLPVGGQSISVEVFNVGHDMTTKGGVTVLVRVVGRSTSCSRTIPIGKRRNPRASNTRPPSAGQRIASSLREAVFCLMQNHIPNW